jgi:Fic family protein
MGHPEENMWDSMVDVDPEGFEGGMSAQKYMEIVKISKTTATRDLHDLVKTEVILVKGGGRSTRYELNVYRCFRIQLFGQRFCKSK